MGRCPRSKPSTPTRRTKSHASHGNYWAASYPTSAPRCRSARTQTTTSPDPTPSLRALPVRGFPLPRDLAPDTIDRGDMTSAPAEPADSPTAIGWPKFVALHPVRPHDDVYGIA